jgi:Fe-S cluster assembly protein SufD
MSKQVTQHTEWYLSNFEIFEKSLNGESNSPIHALRRDAITRFAVLGFPTTKQEEWRFTNVSPIANTNFKPIFNPVSPAAISHSAFSKYTFNELNCHLLVFLDGHFSKELSKITPLPNGIKIGSLADALQTDGKLIDGYLTRPGSKNDDAFTLLSTAFMRDGAFIYVPDNNEVKLPIHLLFLSTGNTDLSLANPRNLIITGKNARLSLIETYASLGEKEYFTNAVTEIFLGEHSVLEHDKLQLEYEGAYHVASAFVHQGRGSNYVSNSISFGGALVRNNVTSVLDAEGSECTLNGLSLGTRQQHIDNHTTIDHAKPNCNSHELYKSILDGKSKGVFNGKIFVRKDAQKTDAKQTNKTLLLSDDATIDTKPQLEIFADDVKCTHGATVGQLDEEQIFYLRSRGIGLDTARDILTFAFASDIIQRIQIEPLRNSLDQMLQARLRRGREIGEI